MVVNVRIPADVRVSPSLACRLLREPAEIDGIAAEWDALWRTLPARSVFQSYGWHRAILDAHGSEREPCVVEARAEGRLAGLLPLSLERGRLGFLAAPYADHNDMLDGTARPGAMLAAMLEVLDLARLPP